ncbi:HAD family hydrolase [uncultured Treponema sp.]|uniref:HAD family hydrolase n=1 Tax=uncultured Treponema sp. TaxID=162155 RepID=UPI0025D310AD|nr:HAD family hydrolase [uncultured Treponema sp.]
MSKFDGVILDVDGTIWNTTGIVAQAWNEAIDENFPQVPHVTAEILKGQFGKTMDVIADNLFGKLSSDEKQILMDKCCEREQKALLSNTKNITYEGVIDTLKVIAGKIPVFIVSNCQKGYIELVIEKNKISGLIKDFECYGNTGLGKAENIRLLAERNGLKAPVYVGDTQGDFEACQKAGVPFIWAAYGFGRPETDDYFAKIDKFSELNDVVSSSFKPASC